MRISGCLFLCTALMATPCFGFPLSFEQRDATHFLARLPDSTAELGLDRLTLRGVTLRFLGAASSARLEGLGPAAPSTYVRAGLLRTFPQFPRLADTAAFIRGRRDFVWERSEPGIRSATFPRRIRQSHSDFGGGKS